MSLNTDIKSILREKGVDYLGVTHKTRRKLFKKEKRRLKRQTDAKRRLDLSVKTSALSESMRALDSAESSLKQEESKLQQYNWIAREKEFLFGVSEKNKIEDARNVIVDRDSEKNDRAREPIKHQAQVSPALTHLPFSPVTHTGTHTSTSATECHFFAKTGACKFGDSCRNSHPCPSVSRTLVFPHLFSGTGVSSSMVDGREQDVELENDDVEIYQRYLDFYEDVFPEFLKSGTVLRVEVCSNQEWHLRGNVFVQFLTTEEAVRCRQALNGRWYDRALVSCEFSCVQDFGQAICQVETAGKLSLSKKYKVCLKGKNCNFWHVFRKLKL